MLSVLCGTLAPAQDCQKRSRRYCQKPSELLLSAYPTADKMERASRTRMFSSRKKPPYAANFPSEGSRSCNDTSGKSTRLFLRVSDTTSSSELEHSKLHSARWSGAHATWHGWTGTALEPSPLHLQSQLTKSFPNREREALFRCIRTDADIKPAKTPDTVEGI